MCCYCDGKADAEIVKDITDLSVPDDVFQCNHGWAEAARVWAQYGHVGGDEDAEDWIDLCCRRAKVLAQLAIASMHPPVRADHGTGSR